jgi:hypothetical protein
VPAKVVITVQRGQVPVTEGQDIELPVPGDPLTYQVKVDRGFLAPGDVVWTKDKRPCPSTPLAPAGANPFENVPCEPSPGKFEVRVSVSERQLASLGFTVLKPQAAVVTGGPVGSQTPAKAVIAVRRGQVPVTQGQSIELPAPGTLIYQVRLVGGHLASAEASWAKGGHLCTPTPVRLPPGISPFEDLPCPLGPGKFEVLVTVSGQQLASLSFTILEPPYFDCAHREGLVECWITKLGPIPRATVVAFEFTITRTATGTFVDNPVVKVSAERMNARCALAQRYALPGYSYKVVLMADGRQCGRKQEFSIK